MYNMKFSISNFSAKGKSSSGGQFPIFKTGVTLIEIIIAISIFVLLSTLGMGAFSSFKKNTDLSSAADTVLTFLIQARSKTLSAENAAYHGVHFENDKIVFYSGSVYAAGDPLNQEIALPSTVEISSVTLLGGGSDVLFQKLTGETDNSGTIVLHLKSDVSKTKTITIQKIGLAIIQ